jgi:hypothetical protein
MVDSTNQIKKRAVRDAKNMKMNTTQTNIGRQVLDPVVRVLDLVIVEIVPVTKKIGQVFRLLDRASLVRYCQHLKIGQVYSISGFFFEIITYILRSASRLIKNLPAPFGTLEGKECVWYLLPDNQEYKLQCCEQSHIIHYSISGFVGAILSASFDCLVPRGSSDTATIFLGAAKRQHLGRLYLGK